MRPYTDADLPRLQAGLAAWTAEAGDLGYCHPGDLAHRIYENLRGRHPVGDLVHVWEAGGAVVGTAVCFGFGTAFDVFAAPSVRGSDRELAMLAAAADTTRRLLDATGAPDPWVVTDVWRGDEARVELLSRLGFAEYRVWDHITERPLDDRLPPPRLPPGYRIRAATLDDHRQLAEARNAAFAETWSGTQYRDEVMTKPGYDPERELLVEAPDGRVAAFTVVWIDARNRTGLFEPVGTHPEHQRRGLARALVLHGLAVMAAAGMTTAVVEHEVANEAAAALYRSLGFTIKHQTLGYRSR